VEKAQEKKNEEEKRVISGEEGSERKDIERSEE
jgi:hypothetical protein